MDIHQWSLELEKFLSFPLRYCLLRLCDMDAGLSNLVVGNCTVCLFPTLTHWYASPPLDKYSDGRLLRNNGVVVTLTYSALIAFPF